MKNITVYEHTNSVYINPLEILLSSVPSYVNHLRKIALESMEKQEAKRAVYAVKKYDNRGSFVWLDIYNPPV